MSNATTPSPDADNSNQDATLQELWVEGVLLEAAYPSGQEREDAFARRCSKGERR